MGQLRKRGNIWWIRYYRAGKRHEESSGGTRKQDAKALLAVREGDIAKGVPVSAKVGRLRFEEAAEDLLNDYRTNGKRSLDEVARRVRLYLAPVFGMRRMTQITTADVRAYIATRQDAGAANGTINRELSALKRMFSLATQAGKVLHRPHIPMLREDNVRTGFFEREEFEAVRAALPLRLQPVVTTAYLTGWRVKSEILSLQWRSVDREAGILRLDPGTTKNRDGRVFPYRDLLPELRDTMVNQWEVHRQLAAEGVISPWVFPRLRGTDPGARIGSFRKAWASACTAAGCPGRIPHDFRRTAVRNLVRAGVPERIAMQLTGHKTRSVFDRYDIVNEADLQDAIGKLGAAMGTKQGQFRQSAEIRSIDATAQPTGH